MNSYLDFYVPENLGWIESKWQLFPDRSVIIINNFLEQKALFNSARILCQLIKKYRINLLLLEGAVGEFSRALFTFSDPSLTFDVCYFFFYKLRVTPAEFIYLIGPKSIHLWGIDDRDLFLELSKIYRGIVESGTGLLKSLAFSLIQTYWNSIQGNKDLALKYEGIQIDYLIKTLRDMLSLKLPGVQAAISRHEFEKSIHNLIELANEACPLDLSIAEKLIASFIPVINFYDLGYKRSVRIANNIVEELNKRKCVKAIVVCSAFHWNKLKMALQASKIGYVSIIPRFAGDASEQQLIKPLTMSIMLGDAMEIPEIFSPIPPIDPELKKDIEDLNKSFTDFE